MCRVSVIVPIYNSEKHLHNCLSSLSVQTLGNIEIIIINDGSTDCSLAIAQEFASNYPWFKVYSIQNKGVSYARNYGVSLSIGKYVAFVDSDDTVEPDYCKAMYDKAIRDENDLVVCGFDRITVLDGKMTHLSAPDKLLDADNFAIKERRDFFSHINVGPWGKLFKRELLSNFEFPEGIRYAEDQIFAVESFCLAQNIGTIKKTLYHYYYEIHDGVTAKFGDERLDWIKVMQLLTAFIQNNDQGLLLQDEIEFFILAKSMRLCSAAIVRTDSDSCVRIRLVKGINDSLKQYFPNWRQNPYYIKDVIDKSRNLKNMGFKFFKGKRVRPLYCNYSKMHALLLIYLSQFFPQVLFDIVLKFDQVLFFSCRWVRWRKPRVFYKMGICKHGKKIN